jgi:hypothetical protein
VATDGCGTKVVPLLNGAIQAEVTIKGCISYAYD